MRRACSTDSLAERTTVAAVFLSKTLLITRVKLLSNDSIAVSTHLL